MKLESTSVGGSKQTYIGHSDMSTLAFVLLAVVMWYLNCFLFIFPSFLSDWRFFAVLLVEDSIKITRSTLQNSQFAKLRSTNPLLNGFLLFSQLFLLIGLFFTLFLLLRSLLLNFHDVIVVVSLLQRFQVLDFLRLSVCASNAGLR